MLNHDCNRSLIFIFIIILMGCAAVLLSPFYIKTASAGAPHCAYYSSDNGNIFWFIHITDTHIGARGSQDSNNLRWVVTTGKNIINPEFIVLSGDLTDSTNGNWLGWPNGPYQAEWDEYKLILAEGDVNAGNFYDIPGNHDAYSDQYFAFYLANSVQGQATGYTQVSWTRQFSFGKYHFLGINTADNSGDPFSLSWPWGDYAGLDAGELAYIQSELSVHNDADLTIVFGHHPVTDTGVSDDTWLYYGAQDFVSLLDQHGASLYGYGHTHRYSEVLFTGDSYTGFMSGDGLVYFNIASLGKSTDNNFSVIAIDCDGISTRTQAIGSWPLVLITTPVNSDLNDDPDIIDPNPYAYSTPNAVNNPIRALVFDAAAISLVQYRIDGGQWIPMQPVPGNSKLWEALWDASGTSEGEHTIEVQATGSTVKSDIIKVRVAVENHAPVAANDTYSVDQGQPLSVNAPGVLSNDNYFDGNPLTAELINPPSKGVLNLNSDGSFTYTPNPGYNGTDLFTYAASDGLLQSSPATVTITVNPVITPDVTPPEPDPMTWFQPPQAVSATSISMTATTATDPSGVEYYFDCVSSGCNDSGWQASAEYIDTDLIPNTSYTYTVKARDMSSNLNQTTVSSEAAATTLEAADIDFVAEGDIPIQGSVDGNYEYTHSDNGIYERLTEVVKNGRWSVLEHKWTFNITGSASVIFKVQAYKSQNTEGDDFSFSYSMDNLTFTNMLVVSNTQDDGNYQNYELPSYTSGKIYIRVMDTDRSKGNTSLDTLFIDAMFITSSGSASLPGPASFPNPPDDATGISNSPTLTWSAGTGAVSHDVYFGIDSNNISLISQEQSGTSFNPGTLIGATTYYWRIDERNSAGITTGDQWHFTTTDKTCTPVNVSVNKPIILSTLRGPAGTSYGQAVVTVVDDCGDPFNGAYVTGSFTGDFTEEQTQQTNSEGQAVFVTKSSVKKPSFDFIVSNIEAFGLIFKP